LSLVWGSQEPSCCVVVRVVVGVVEAADLDRIPGVGTVDELAAADVHTLVAVRALGVEEHRVARLELRPVDGRPVLDLVPGCAPGLGSSLPVKPLDEAGAVDPGPR